MLNKYGKIGSIAIFILVAILCAFGIGRCTRAKNEADREYRLNKAIARQDSITQIVVKQDAQLKEEYEKIITRIILNQKRGFRTYEEIQNSIPDSLSDAELRREISRILFENGAESVKKAGR